ncbi:acyl-CoA dehydrogenase family protein, partial [Acinetobacter nosocomialis]|uniref:acyl-CoA dehydrogenase family protein n=1 Tax=Acinetobacter nosocomialis TaxID=106654 RepID=UPI0025AE4128
VLEKVVDMAIQLHGGAGVSRDTPLTGFFAQARSLRLADGPDENTNNAGTSYYNKGALVALCLDLGLRLRGSSLDALMRRL